MKIPGPDHPISIAAAEGRVQVILNGEIVADTLRAKVLKEASYPPVFYIPREDAALDRFTRTATATHCPYKGDATYYSVTVGERTSADAAWSYETPFPAMAAIAGHLAFYPGRVDEIREQTS